MLIDSQLKYTEVTRVYNAMRVTVTVGGRPSTSLSWKHLGLLQ